MMTIIRAIRRPRSYPQVLWASLFRLPCITAALSWSQMLMDSSLDMRIAKKQIGPDAEAAIGDTSCGRCGPWFPAKIAALGT
jgi:hypothetical protein